MKTNLVKASAYCDAYIEINGKDVEGKKALLQEMLSWLHSLKLAEVNPQIKLRIQYCNCHYSYLTGNYHEAYSIFLKLIKQSYQEEDSYYLGNLYRTITLMSYFKGAFNIALENGYKAIEYFEKANVTKDTIQSIVNIGIVFTFLEDYDKQLEYFKKALHTAMQTNDLGSIRLILNNIAYTYYLKEDYQQCHVYLNKTKEYYPNGEEDYNYVAFILTQASLALSEKRVKDAFELLQYFEANKYPEIPKTFLLDWHYEFAKYYMQVQDERKQLEHLEAGFEVAVQIENTYYQTKFLEELTLYYQTRDQYNIAFDYLDKTNELLKNANRVKDDYQYMLLQVEYELDQISREMTLLNDELKVTQESAIYALAALAEYRDEVTGKHILRTVQYVEAFLRQISDFGIAQSFSSEDIKNISQSAALHDIGKVGISDDILYKPDMLTDEEFNQIKRHTTIGYDALATTKDILGNQSFLQVAMTIALTHHEKWDGSGYPSGTSGEEIPFVGRIVAIIDVYDALISKRPYKESMPHMDAIAIIKEGTGRHFDPTLVRIFLENHLIFYNIAYEQIDSDEERQTLEKGMDVLK